MNLIIKTAEERQAEALARHQATVTAAIDAHVEAQARALGYNSAAHLASYVASGVPEWAAEATAFVTWRDDVWTAALGMLADAQASGEVPSVEDAIGTLPDFPANSGPSPNLPYTHT